MYSRSTKRSRPRTSSRKRVTRIKGGIRPNATELKYLDTVRNSEELAAIPIWNPLKMDTLALRDGSGSTQMHCLNVIDLGDDNNRREGRQCLMKSVQIKARVYQRSNSAATVGQMVRLMLVVDSAANGKGLSRAKAAELEVDRNGFLSPYDILQQKANKSDVGITPPHIAFPDVDNQSRFTILWDKQVYLGPTDLTADSPYADQTGKFVEYYRKLNFVTQFEDQKTVAEDGDAFRLYASANPPEAGKSVKSLQADDIQNGSLYFIVLGSEKIDDTCTTSFDPAAPANEILDPVPPASLGTAWLGDGSKLNAPIGASQHTLRYTVEAAGSAARVAWSARIRYTDA